MTIRCRGIGCHTSMAARAPARPRERSSPSARGIPSSSLRPIDWRKKCGPGASRPRPITTSSAGVARQNGRPKGWGSSSFPGSSGTRNSWYPAPRGRSSLTGSRVTASRTSAVVTRGSNRQSPDKRPHEWLRDTADYYEEVEVDHRAKEPLLKDLKTWIRLHPDKVQCKDTKGASWLPRVGTLRGGLEAM